MAVFTAYGQGAPSFGFNNQLTPQQRSRPLTFRVVSSSSYSDIYPAENLTLNTGATTGWVSDEFCSFPQDLVVEFPSLVVIESIQLIVNKYLIPTVVDVFLIQNDANPGMGVASTDLQPVAQFRFPDTDAEFWNNEPILKDVRFQPPLVARFVQISCHRLRCRDISVAQLIVRLENYKQSAVRNDDFQTAASTKTIIDELTKIEDQVHELEMKKDEAIQDEDYQLAEDYKYNVFELTIAALKYLRCNRFGHFFEKEQLKELEDSLRKRRLRPAAAQISAKVEEPCPPEGFGTITGSSTASNRSRMCNTSPDRPLRPSAGAFGGNSENLGSFEGRQGPCMETSLQQMRKQGMQPRGPKDGENLKKGAQNQLGGYQYSIDVFGAEIIDLISSPAFPSRVQGLERVNTILDNAVAEGPKSCTVGVLIRATVALLDTMLKEDAIIVQLTAHLILKLLDDIVPAHPESKSSEVPGVLAMALPFALSRLGSTNRRISQILMPFVIELAKLAAVKSLPTVPQVCCDALKSTAQSRYSVGRVRVVQDLLTSLQIGESSGMTLELLVQFSISAMEHLDPEVRPGGEKIIIGCMTGNLRRPSVPPPDEERKAAYQDISKKPTANSAAGGIGGTGETDVELAEARSNIRIVISRNRGAPSPTKTVRSSDTFSKEKTSPASESDNEGSLNALPGGHSPVGGRTVSPASVWTKDSIPPPSLVPPAPLPPTVGAPLGEIIALRKGGKSWKHLQVLAGMLEQEGYFLVGKDGLGKDQSSWPHNVVTACPFCGKPDTAKDLNYHLYQECPMLKKCAACDNKVLIPDMTNHELERCVKRHLVEVCPKCRLAFPKKQLSKHLKANECVDPTQETNATVCPLCHELVERSDDGWVHHLLDKQHGCEKNPRRKKALKWTEQLATKDSTGNLVKITGNSLPLPSSPPAGPQQ
ncbi:putative Centrosomal [Hypsibius exemplaris]|uniref:Centrosomal n=1 Tax=Hypsibius exemplaris TaxID=2072580 RepID=A0A9X6NCI1_HYPEX|nr:putative Centrosomal [Hypsibius exemplaris]